MICVQGRDDDDDPSSKRYDEVVFDMLKVQPDDYAVSWSQLVSAWLIYIFYCLFESSFHFVYLVWVILS